MPLKAVSTMSNDELDYLVARAENIAYLRDVSGHTLEIQQDKRVYGKTKNDGRIFPFTPATDWRSAGPIIQRVHISIQQLGDLWVADMGREFQASGPTPLIAAMRTLVISHFGHMVDID